MELALKETRRRDGEVEKLRFLGKGGQLFGG
jgi:hypothetical protein